MSHVAFGSLSPEKQSAQLEVLLASAEKALARAEALLRQSYTIPMLRWPEPTLEVRVLDQYPEDRKRQ
jgi:hypothetical protein